MKAKSRRGSEANQSLLQQLRILSGNSRGNGKKENEEALGINHFITNICYFLAVLAARDLVSRQMWEQTIM